MKKAKKLYMFISSLLLVLASFSELSIYLINKMHSHGSNVVASSIPGADASNETDASTRPALSKAVTSSKSIKSSVNQANHVKQRHAPSTPSSARKLGQSLRNILKQW